MDTTKGKIGIHLVGNTAARTVLVDPRSDPLTLLRDGTWAVLCRAPGAHPCARHKSPDAWGSHMRSRQHRVPDVDERQDLIRSPSARHRECPFHANDTLTDQQLTSVNRSRLLIASGRLVSGVGRAAGGALTHPPGGPATALTAATPPPPSPCPCPSVHQPRTCCHGGAAPLCSEVTPMSGQDALLDLTRNFVEVHDHLMDPDAEGPDEVGADEPVHHQKRELHQPRLDGPWDLRHTNPWDAQPSPPGPTRGPGSKHAHAQPWAGDAQARPRNLGCAGVGFWLDRLPPPKRLH